MIETIILNYLTAAGITAVMEVPEGGGTPPFVVVERTGGGESNLLRQATVAIRSYGASLYAAAALNDLVVKTMEGLPELPSVAACDLNSDYNYTDTEKRQYRYQAVFDIVYYDD